MPHGLHDYYLERARFERRLSLITVFVSVAALGLESLFGFPLARHRGLRYSADPRRFGFEGPNQYVQRIVLEYNGPPGPMPGRPTIVYRSMGSRKGGRDPAEKASAHPNARPDTRRAGRGEGESSADLVAQARVIYGGGAPVVRSEDLVITDLVRPEYPAESLDRNAEGTIAVVALVDTTGTVTSVDLMSSTGERQLEEAALAAVRRCRFRPYLVAGHVTEVRAVFRFAFRIYD